MLIELEAADTPRNNRLTEALATAGLRLALRSGSNQGGVVNAIFTRAAARVVAGSGGESSGAVTTGDVACRASDQQWGG